MDFEPTADRLLPDLDIRTEMVLLARTLWREGYDDHLAGHITVNQGDGTLLCNPWLLTWEEFRPRDVIRIDLEGNVVEGDWPVPLGIPLHLELHRARPDVQVAVHHHPRWGTVWADLGRLPGRYDQSSVLGGGDGGAGRRVRRGGQRPVDRGQGHRAPWATPSWRVLAHHGVFVLGGSIRAAHQRCVAFESALPVGLADRGRRRAARNCRPRSSASSSGATARASSASGRLRPAASSGPTRAC